MAALLTLLPCVAAASLSFLPDGFLSTPHQLAFDDAVASIRAAVVCIGDQPYSRHGGGHRAADRPMGGLLVRPPPDRRVSVVDGFRAHFDAAASLPFLPDSRLRASALPPDMRCAVKFAATQGAGLAAARTSTLSALRSTAIALLPVSRRINQRMPGHVARIASAVNTAFMAAMVDALAWLDVTIVERFVMGFPIVGVIPDSGVYRSVEPSASLASHTERAAYFNSSAPWWNRRLLDRLHARAWASGEERAADTAVAAKSAKELSKGVIVGPYLTPTDLHRSMTRMFPTLPHDEVYPRVMNRFGVRQKDSVRAIDDGRSNGANGATRLFETVTTPHFYFSAVVARAMAVVTRASSLPMPSMTVALLDLTMAYRTVPTSQPWLTAVAFYNPAARPPRPEIYWLPGHNFGLASAVVNFNRFPELVVVAARALLGVAADHYYDDFIVPDVAAGGHTGRLAVEELVLLLGPCHPRQPWAPVQSPEIDPDKTKLAAHTNVVLGVVTNLSLVDRPEAMALFTVEPARVTQVLADFQAALDRGAMTPHEASRLRGKLFFLLSAAFGMVGRAATLPLVQRQYRDTSYSFVVGSELHHSYLFFAALLPRLPPLHMALLPHAEPPLLVYTDASFSERRRPRGQQQCAADDPARRLNGALGAVVWDPVVGCARFAHAEPPWRLLLASWRTDRRTYIAELETLAAISIYSTYPELFYGRRVNHFIDNTVALSALVHGYAGKPDLAKQVNIFYLQMVRLRAHVYFDYVPSKANIADLPSRRDFAATRMELAGLPICGRGPDTLVVPSVSQWSAPLTSWATSSSAADAAPAHA